MAHVLSVNVRRPHPVRTGRRTVTTAIWKAPVEGRVTVRGVNLDGDDQADPSVHGGPDKAVYAYAIEEIHWWEAELGRKLGPAAFGENLTTEGLDVSGALVGERWRVEVDVGTRPDHGVTVRLISDAILLDHSLIPQVLAAPQPLPSLRDWMTGRVS